MTGRGRTGARGRRKVLVSLPVMAVVAGAGALVPFGAANASASHGHATLTVATHGSDRGNCQRSSCATLGYALTQAGPGDSIVVFPGSYAESGNANVVGPNLTGLTIRSAGRAADTVIDATGDANGLLIEASGVSVTGLTVENASLEGILAEPPRSTWPATATSPAAGISHVTIADDVVTGNDRAYDPSLPAGEECPSSLTDADDCGEGIHLLAVSWSRVIGDNVTHNVGGIMVSDGGFGISAGPAAHDLIAGNRAVDNVYDCGITLPGHDARAVATSGPDTGQPQPSLAGVYDNLIVGNVSNGNGGAGLLDATPYPGTGAYDNTFVDNTASGNGNGGFVMHSHAPLQDVSGIVVSGNRFGQNNLAGDADTGVTATTGVMLLSVAVPVSVDVSGNTISGDTDGVAYNSEVTVTGHNRFSQVASDYITYTPPAP